MPVSRPNLNTEVTLVGRPPPKDAVVRMRISTTQKQALKAAAGRDGLALSAWLRQLALRAAGVLPESK